MKYFFMERMVLTMGGAGFTGGIMRLEPFVEQVFQKSWKIMLPLMARLIYSALRFSKC